jgi:hypothetical protein
MQAEHRQCQRTLPHSAWQHHFCRSWCRPHEALFSTARQGYRVKRLMGACVHWMLGCWDPGELRKLGRNRSSPELSLLRMNRRSSWAMLFASLLFAQVECGRASRRWQRGHEGASFGVGLQEAHPGRLRWN